MSDLPRLPQTPMLDSNGKPFYPLTQYNQIVMPGGGRWDGNPGSSVELDTTLKVAGKAADAAAVGAAVDELKNEIDDLLPDVTADDAGKFLRVSSAGTWVAETVASAEGVSF